MFVFFGFASPPPGHALAVGRLLRPRVTAPSPRPLRLQLPPAHPLRSQSQAAWMPSRRHDVPLAFQISYVLYLLLCFLGYACACACVRVCLDPNFLHHRERPSCFSLPPPCFLGSTPTLSTPPSSSPTLPLLCRLPPLMVSPLPLFCSLLSAASLFASVCECVLWCSSLSSFRPTSSLWLLYGVL